MIGLLDVPVTVVGVDYGHIPSLVLLATITGGTGLVAVVAAIRRNRYALGVLLTLVTLATGYVTSLTGYLGLTGVTIGRVTVEFGTLLGAVIGAGIAVRVVRWTR
ncbi:hypothetical protein ACFQ1S_32195 [Kibdelosporangium lantanae]|uniref:Uncharacterized protein n=1 Tax=Kibdelosporangium lantanae TaxID=1497396 RepID=A0ABW3MK97_9PSEU